MTYSFEHDPTIPPVFTGECAATISINFLIYKKGEVQALDSKTDMAAEFAPIESPEEALSYAVAVTGYQPVYNLESVEEIRLLANRVEETYVITRWNRYVVHFDDFFLCHCGPSMIQAVDVTVFKNGEIALAEPVDAYSDPRMDVLCID